MLVRIGKTSGMLCLFCCFFIWSTHRKRGHCNSPYMFAHYCRYSNKISPVLGCTSTSSSRGSARITTSVSGKCVNHVVNTDRTEHMWYLFKTATGVSENVVALLWNM